MAGPSDRPAIVTNQDGGGPATPTRGTEPVPLPPLENGRNTLTWRSCDGSIAARLADPPLPANLKVECGQLTAILDPPALPGRSTTKLALLKVGTGPVPLAVVNDIDGLPGTVFA